MGGHHRLENSGRGLVSEKGAHADADADVAALNLWRQTKK
jgi:hypothetical protein